MGGNGNQDPEEAWKELEGSWGAEFDSPHQILSGCQVQESMGPIFARG